MNYLFENNSGVRTRITDMQYHMLCRKSHEVKHLVKTGDVRVLAHVTHKPCNMERFYPKKWGGSKQQRNPFNANAHNGNARMCWNAGSGL